MTEAVDDLVTEMTAARAREEVAHIEVLRNLRKLRERGVTPGELAKLTGISQRTIEHLLIRAGDAAPDIRPVHTAALLRNRGSLRGRRT